MLSLAVQTSSDCSGDARPDPQNQWRDPPNLCFIGPTRSDAAKIGDVPMTIRKLDDHVTVCGAMTQEDFARAATLGFKSIINNRDVRDNNLSVTPEEEAEYAAKHGLAYRHIPMASGTLSIAASQEFAEALEELPKPVLAHCGGGTRSATLWALSQCPTCHDVDEILETTANAGFDFSGLRPLMRGLKEDTSR